MAKIRYTLTADRDFVRLEFDASGTPILVFEWDCEDHYVEDADSLGNYQSDCLWEIFEHSFEPFDDDGTPVEYDEHTSERINPTPLDDKEIKTIEHVRRWFATRTAQVTDVRRMNYSGGVMSFVEFDNRVSLRVDPIWGSGWTKKWNTMTEKAFELWVGNRVKKRIDELSDYGVNDRKYL